MGTQLLGHSAKHDPMILGHSVKHDPMMLGPADNNVGPRWILSCWVLLTRPKFIGSGTAARPNDNAFGCQQALVAVGPAEVGPIKDGPCLY
jgi:hypothetical protein